MTASAPPPATEPSPSPTPSSGPRPPAFWIWPAVGIGLAVLLSGSIWLAGSLRTPPSQPDFISGGENPPIQLALTVPDFEFTERSERTIRRADLLGHVWVADFVFTNCAGTCPILTSSMRLIQEQCADLPDLRLVSITVDPDRDTPARMRAYADSQGCDPDRWLFLTGTQEKLYAFAQDAFKLAAGTVPADQRTPEMEEFTHSTRLVLVDADGRVVGLFDGTDHQSVQALIAELRRRLPPAAK